MTELNLIIHHDLKYITFDDYPSKKWIDIFPDLIDNDILEKTSLYFFFNNLVDFFKKDYTFIIDAHWEGYCINKTICHSELDWNFFDLLERIKKERNISHSYFKFVSGNLYYYFYKHCEWNHTYLHWFMNNDMFIYKYNPNPNPSYKFCYLNRNPKWSRVRLYEYMLKDNVLKNCVWSWNSVNEKNYELHKDFHISKSLEENFIGFHDEDTLLNGTQEAIHDSIVQIVVESEIAEVELSITEKIVKCIDAKKPFVVLGSMDLLKCLHKLNFKTFSDFWDEDYDDETEFNKRVDKVYKTIQEINKKSLEELNQLYNSDKMQDILKHNHGVLHDMKFNQESWEKTVLKPSWQTQEVKYLINKLDIIKKIENIEIKKINIDKSQLI